jgi:hypothetical protein
LSSTQTSYDLKGHIAAHTEASKLTAVLLNRFSRELSLQKLHTRHVHLKLIDVVLGEVSELKSSMVMNDSAVVR